MGLVKEVIVNGIYIDNTRKYNNNKTSYYIAKKRPVRKYIKIHITKNEFKMLIDWAKKRRAFAKNSGCKDMYSAKYKTADEQLFDEFIGLVGEYAVCKYFKKGKEAIQLYIKDPTKYKAADVLHFHVRATRYENGCLIVTLTDKMSEPFILVTTCNTINYGKEGTKNTNEIFTNYSLVEYVEIRGEVTPNTINDIHNYLNKRKDSYFIPQNELHDIVYNII